MFSRAIFSLLAFLVVLPAYSQEPRKVLLLAQKPDGHPPLTHEYRPGLRIVEILLGQVKGLKPELVMADEPWREGPELLNQCEGAVVFLSEGARWLSENPQRLQAFQKLAARKGGLAVIHWGMGTKEAKNIAPFVDLFGACHGGPDRKYQVLKTEAEIVGHPSTAGLKNFPIREEFYYHLKRNPQANLEPVVFAEIDGAKEMVGWAWQRPDGGRSFGFSGLHFHENWRLPEYRRLLLQGIVWSMGLPVPAEGLPVSIAPAVLEVK